MKPDIRPDTGYEKRTDIRYIPREDAEVINNHYLFASVYIAGGHVLRPAVKTAADGRSAVYQLQDKKLPPTGGRRDG